MQNAELFRRGIVVPLDRDAEESLRVNNVNDSTNVRYLSIANDRMFETLWEVGLFREINSRCASLLDDYEEEMVETSSAAGILAAIESVAGNAAAQQPDVVKFLEDTRILVNEASTLSRPILFVL
jgi:hypothetical protein